MLAKMAKLISLSFLICALPSCVTVPNVKGCSVAGRLSAGATCAESLSQKTSEMTLHEFLTFLEPDQATQKGGAICFSSVDAQKLITALLQACQKAGSFCKRETVQQIEETKKKIDDITKPGKKREAGNN